jgi:unsaturated chondroitin disaccharide hydrolase
MRQELLTKLRAAFDFAQRQVRALVTRLPDYHPVYTVQGKWGRDAERWNPGPAGSKALIGGPDALVASMAWMFFRVTGDDSWRVIAEARTAKLDDKRFDRENQDLGVLFMNTYARWFRISRDRRHLAMVLQAARTLARRFQSKGEYLCSAAGPGSLFIDMMLNVELLFYAGKAGSDLNLTNTAISHCRTTHRYLVREDGGTAQEGIFELGTGIFLREGTQQGYKANSTWARGLATAVYGFGVAYHYTQIEEFLITAEECAEFYLERARPDGMMTWDLDCPPGPKRLDDSSAAAIAANGLWNLAGLTKDRDRKMRYAEGAMRILETLASPQYLAKDKPGQEGILLHGVYHMGRQLGVDESLIFGDHYFVEALYKVVQDRRGKRVDAATGTAPILPTKPAVNDGSDSSTD